MKNLLIGDRPPPVGGVTIFVDRLYKRMLTDGHDVISIELGKTNKIKRYFLLAIILIYPLKLNVFLNGINFDFLKCMILRKFKTKLVYINHNDRIRNLAPLRKELYKSFFEKVDKVILTNKDQIDDYANLGIDISSKYITIPAFIAPIEKELDIATLPFEIVEFVNKYNYIISANASSLAFYNDQDLYGVDLAINLMKNLINNKSIGLVYCITKITDVEYYNMLKAEIRRLNLQNHILLYTNSINFPALLKRTDLFIRPTNTDGDSISVREAIALGVPTIASDVVDRPSKVVTFKNRDISDLVSKANHIINNRKNKVLTKEFVDNYAEIVNIVLK